MEGRKGVLMRVLLCMRACFRVRCVGSTPIHSHRRSLTVCDANGRGVAARVCRRAGRLRRHAPRRTRVHSAPDIRHHRRSHVLVIPPLPAVRRSSRKAHPRRPAHRPLRALPPSIRHLWRRSSRPRQARPTEQLRRAGPSSPALRASVFGALKCLNALKRRVQGKNVSSSGLGGGRGTPGCSFYLFVGVFVCVGNFVFVKRKDDHSCSRTWGPPVITWQLEHVHIHPAPQLLSFQPKYQHKLSVSAMSVMPDVASLSVTLLLRPPHINSELRNRK